MKKSKYNINLNEPSLKGHTKSYINKCIKSRWISSVGPNVNKLEESFAKTVNTKYAVACSSGTSALHLSLLSLNIGSQDIVLVSSLTFIATINTIKYVGAQPIIVDINKNNYHMDLNILEDFLIKDCFVKGNIYFHKKTKKKISCILVTHILGHGCDILKFKNLAKKYKIFLIEDAAEALGALYKKKLLGSIGQVGCFSFNGNKIITTGSGGMLVTNSKKIAKNAKHLSTQAKKNGVEFIHDEIGYNYRMSNLHASLGLAQLEMLKNFIEKKKYIARRYIKFFSNVNGVSWIKPIEDITSTWWLFTIIIDDKKIKIPAKYISDKLNKMGIQSRRLWRPMHMLNPYKNEIRLGGKNSENIYKSAISLPSSTDLKKKDQKIIMSEIYKIINT